MNFGKIGVAEWIGVGGVVAGLASTIMSSISRDKKLEDTVERKVSDEMEKRGYFYNQTRDLNKKDKK